MATLYCVEKPQAKKEVKSPTTQKTTPQKKTAKPSPVSAAPPTITATTQSPSLLPQPASTEMIRQVQERLRATGFDPGPADGTMGPRTREALQRYQAREGLPVTGTLDAAPVLPSG